MHVRMIWLWMQDARFGLDRQALARLGIAFRLNIYIEGGSLSGAFFTVP
jgi:hypothetical protein